MRTDLRKTMGRRRLVTILAVALAMCAGPVVAAALQEGDVLEASIGPSIEPQSGDIFLLRSGQVFQSFVHFPSDPASGLVVDPLNRTYALRDHDIEIFDSTGTLIRTITPGLSFPSRAVFDAAGNLYVSAGNQMNMLTSSGDVLATFTMNIPFGGIDLGTDQCTMYFASGKTLGRFDVCRSVRLPDVTAVLPSAFSGDVRILPDGTFIVAGDVSAVRVSATGVLLRTYSIPADSIALSPDARTFWAGPGLYRIDVESGTILEQLGAPSPTLALAVAGEWRAHLVNASIPTLASVTLAILAGILSLLAIVQLRT